ncbi:hypothetical protein [Streptomyces sp. NPDC059080]
MTRGGPEGGLWNAPFEGIGDWTAADYHTSRHHTGRDELREMLAAEDE